MSAFKPRAICVAGTGRLNREVRRSEARSYEVAPGVYRLGTRWANFYLVLDGPGLTVIDAGYPRYVGQLEQAVAALGKTVRDIAAVIVTHHHVDHAGTAEAIRSRADARIFVHERDAAIVRGERASHPPTGFFREAWRPSMIRYLLHTLGAGGARYRAVADVTTWGEDRLLDLPGRPRLIPTPGHTAGHTAVLLAERGTLFVGDAMVNFDYATGERGLRLHRFNEDRKEAVTSLARLEGLEPEVVLFGHGDPWRGDLGQALKTVRASS